YDQEKHRPHAEAYRAHRYEWNHQAFFLAGESGGNEEPELVKDDGQDQNKAGDHGNLALNEKRLQRSAVIQSPFFGIGNQILIQSVMAVNRWIALFDLFIDLFFNAGQIRLSGQGLLDKFQQ